MNIKRVDSTDEDVCKYVFDFDTAVAEAVLYKYPTYEERTVICCSTQSGCPVGCRFCGAGDNFCRNLTGEEIAGQVISVLADKDIDHRTVKKGQVMFMSMGEPMLNYPNVMYAIRKLHMLFPTFDMLISTVGPAVDYTRFIKLSEDVPKIGLQFSVHESTDEARNKLIPFKAKMNLEQIAETGERWAKATGRKPFFNYCAHEGNTSEEDAQRLADTFNPLVWECTVSVICERDESVATANIRQQELATGFMSKMLERGFSTRCFNPAGQDDIGGGCGQLWYVQQWMKEHANSIKPSAGKDLDKIHIPK